MRIFSTISFLLPFATSSTLTSDPPASQLIFSNPPSSSSHSLKIPTVHESAILARRMLHLTPLGTLSTVFPSTPSTLENRPPDLGGMPFGLTEYVSDCEGTGDPTILSVNIATSFKNVAAGSNISLTIQWTPLYPPKQRITSSSFWQSIFSSGKGQRRGRDGGLPYSAANLPRFNLLGYLEKIEKHEVESKDVKGCYVRTHPDAKYWTPGSDIHESEWVRLVVQEVYYMGGFGDRAYIGWIPVSTWRNISQAEWQEARLPGEKRGWKEGKLEL